MISPNCTLVTRASLLFGIEAAAASVARPGHSPRSIAHRSSSAQKRLLNCLISLPPAKDICGWQGHLSAAGKSENFPFIHYKIIPRAPSDFQDKFCRKKTIFERNRENSCIVCTKCYQAFQPHARKKSSRHFSRLRPPDRGTYASIARAVSWGKRPAERRSRLIQRLPDKKSRETPIKTGISRLHLTFDGRFSCNLLFQQSPRFYWSSRKSVYRLFTTSDRSRSSERSRSPSRPRRASASISSRIVGFAQSGSSSNV